MDFRVNRKFLMKLNHLEVLKAKKLSLGRPGEAGGNSVPGLN
jgi:hypothetical protein